MPYVLAVAVAGMLPVPAGAGPVLPDGFVACESLIPGLRTELRYATPRNFVGTRVDGYLSPRCIISRKAATALAAVQAELSPFGLGLKIYDAYRPQRAVDHFVRWAADPAATGTKAEYYPGVEKQHLFRDDYISARSGHSRGSTVDLTLVALAEDGGELDMGTGFDFFGPESWPDHPGATPQQRANRLLLREVMTRHGFRPYSKEWWHFTLEREPFPATYFNFPIE